ncbi:MAG: hypothetical protein Q4P32_05615, partial [Micrococcales bacterium]|nr:hypothetical protein [Micrococcales bacterium]
LGARERAAAVVVHCPRGLGSLTHADDTAADEAGEAGDGCIVRFTDTSARLRTATLEHPGLFSLDPGDEITVVLRDGGAVAMAGWQPLADAGLLLLLAVAVSGNAVGWWRRVLEHRDPRYDGGDPLDDVPQSRSGTDQDRKDPRDL